jgi:hypothetical protein
MIFKGLSWASGARVDIAFVLACAIIGLTLSFDPLRTAYSTAVFPIPDATNDWGVGKMAHASAWIFEWLGPFALFFLLPLAQMTVLWVREQRLDVRPAWVLGWLLLFSGSCVLLQMLVTHVNWGDVSVLVSGRFGQAVATAFTPPSAARMIRLGVVSMLLASGFGLVWLRGRQIKIRSIQC